MFRRRRPSPGIPYDMFSHERTRAEAHAARKLEQIYHRGQDRIWDGQETLQELLDRHGGIQLAPERLEPLSRIFAVIFWGELAAWKVAAELALELEPLEAKLAATSQAHDEARHFYVLHDYLEHIGYAPGPLPPSATRVLGEVVGASNLARKLLGMHLMVEPIALTLFQLVRQHQLEPVLCDLLAYYERDEARHVALGVHHLPALIAQLSPREQIALWRWQLHMFMLQLDGLRELEPDVRALGFHPRDVVRLGQQKQLHAAETMMEQMGRSWDVRELFIRVVEARMEWDFPQDGQSRAPQARMRRALHAAVRGPDRAAREALAA